MGEKRRVRPVTTYELPEPALTFTLDKPKVFRRDLRIDSVFFQCGEALEAGPEATVLYLAAMCHSVDSRLGGFISADYVPNLIHPRSHRRAEMLAERLVSVGLWRPASLIKWKCEGFFGDTARWVRGVAPLAARAPIKKELRLFVLERDEFACVRCGSGEHLHVDHIFPVVRGGTDDLGNLQTLCRSCNCSKGAKV